MAVNPVTRRRLEAQGFCNLDDTALEEIGPWLRWSPSICLFFMVLGVLLTSPFVLWALAAVAALGALLPFHPFDLLYNHGMRYFTGTRPFPHHGAQRRFACGVAAIWLIATGWAFSAGALMLAYILGALLIFVAALVSFTNFCIPSFIYNTLFRPGTPP